METGRDIIRPESEVTGSMIAIVEADIEARNWARNIQVGDYHLGSTGEASLRYEPRSPEWYSFVFAASEIAFYVLTDDCDLVTYVSYLEVA